MKWGKLWCFLSVIFIATLIIMITFFYGVTTRFKQLKKFVKPRASTFVGEQLAIEPNVIEALKNDHYSDELEAYTVRLGEIHQLILS